MLTLAVVLAAPAQAEVTIQLTLDREPHVEVTGIPPTLLTALSQGQINRAPGQRVFTLYVIRDGAPATTPVLGDYAVIGDRLRFTPRFPLRPGLSYRAVFDSAAVDAESTNDGRIEVDLAVPAPAPTQPTVVEAVYPSSDLLPENLLKFYIHFSAPMQRGDIYRHMRLLTGEGEAVDLPFLELAEELWDESGTRLTLLLDPGRVKQELKPHQEVGRALTAGHDYVLYIATDWQDAHRNPLHREFRKLFKVSAPDTRQPNPHRWRLTAPKAGTQRPLVVIFEEPLDHAMLQRTIQVQNPTSGMVEGSISVDEQEQRWSFRPARPWVSGTHRLLIDGTLEDRAGNSVERPFEVFLPAGRPDVVNERVIAFEVR